MSFRYLLLCILCFPWSALALQETWETGYSGEDVSGKHVLGHWSFEKTDALKLHGAVLSAKGRFGSALESFPGFPVEDVRHAALVSVLPVKGAFTLEMWIKPKMAFKPELRCFLLDKKYVDQTDYQWQIGEADKGGLRRMWVTLGFGAESRTIYSLPFELKTDAWQHVAFTYDGAGEGRFYRNGAFAGGSRLQGVGAVVPGKKELSIGDRLGSNYGGFPGLIDEVRVCDGVLSFERVALQIAASRSVWRRMETAKPIAITVTNLKRDVLKSATLKASLAGKTEEFLLPDLAAGKSFTANYSLNTALKATTYELRAHFASGDYSTEQSTVLKIVPRMPIRMPVIMWGGGGDEIARMKDIGFTHFIGLGADYGEIWQQKKLVPPAKPEVIAKNRVMLDTALENDLGVIASLSPAHALESDVKILRVDRAGKPYTRQDIAASMPEFAPFFQTVGQSVARAYGDHPAFTTALIDTEVRDSNQVSFNPTDVEAYKKFASADIPTEVMSKGGVDWTKLKDFPADRVIADDHPILKYLRWFWTVGDGWNGLHTALHKGVKMNSRLWTFFDPAVRQPSISGAGGGVDVLSHWTYTYPDPQKIGMCADQLFAMSAASGKNQRVMKMTQLIWYRSQTAPISQKAAGELVAWEDHDPEAAYITIAPLHLKEALWTKIARPIEGIMYHGWQSLVQTDSPGAYRFTNPNTAPVLKQLIKDVIEPLGPTLMSIPDERSEVAFLESFTSQMFARRGGYGSNTGWEADVWLALQHAHVQTDIIFEETLLKNGLSGRKVLVMPFCDVLTKSVVARIADWQKKGGKIVADEFLCPALKADVLIQSFKREKKAAEDKAKVLVLAKSFKARPQKVSCDNPEIITRMRRFGDATYVFVVNDKREYGSYVGQHGLVMENGLPASGMVSLKAESANVYELTGTQFIVPKRGDDGSSMGWKVDLGPGDGKIFVVLPKPLLGLKLDLPENATAGQKAAMKLQITSTGDAPLRAVIPVKIAIRDANGVLTEGSGYYAAVNGVVDLSLDLAPNDDSGTWEVRVKELASGMEAVKWMQVKRDL
ncbi:MAG: LamG domain-containing protein [Verrucomicrobiaceae bacterium]|nr:LamG domain-containing protein [Verrucomicrobiaceae bacterium]